MKMEFNKIDFSGKIFFPLIFLVLVITIILPKDYLVLRSLETGEVLFFDKIKGKTEFKISYTHSIEKTEVSQCYSIENKKIILKEERYKSLGAGLAANTPYSFKKDEDGFLIYDINEEINPLIYRTGRVANHILYIDGEKYLFRDFSSGGEGVTFNIEKHSPITISLEGLYGR